MAEYTYEDIIIDPTSEKARTAIGKKCYMYDSPTSLVMLANNNELDNLLTLESIDNESEFPFVAKADDLGWSCIIVKKEDPYSEHLKKWIEDNNVKAGDYVRVTRTIDYDDENFNAAWTDEMDRCAGKTMRVLKVDDYSGITLENLCIFPYFVLEKVEEPKPKYVPFKSKEEFIEAFHYHDNANYSETEDILMNYGMWLKSKDEGYFVQVWIITTSGIQTEYSCCPESWEDLLANYTFLDGMPCGKSKEN